MRRIVPLTVCLPTSPVSSEWTRLMCCFLEADLVLVVNNPQLYIASQGLIFSSHIYQRLSDMPQEKKKKAKGKCSTHVDVIPRSDQIDKINKHPNKRLYVLTYLHAKLSKLQVMPFPINVGLQLSEKVCWTLLLIILPCTIMHLLRLCWQLTKEWQVQWCHMESHFLKGLLWPYPLLVWKWMRHFTKR